MCLAVACPSQLISLVLAQAACLAVSRSLTQSLPRSHSVSLSLFLFRSRPFFIAFIHSFSFYELHLRSPSRSLARTHTHRVCRAQAGTLSLALSRSLALTFVNCPEHCWLRWFPVHSRAKRKEEAIINVPPRRKTLITRFAPLAHEGVQELRCLGGCCLVFGFGGGGGVACSCALSIGSTRTNSCPNFVSALLPHVPRATASFGLPHA